MNKRTHKMTKVDWLFLSAMVLANGTGQWPLGIVIAAVWAYTSLARRVHLLEARGAYENEKPSKCSSVQEM